MNRHQSRSATFVAILAIAFAACLGLTSCGDEDAQPTESQSIASSDDPCVALAAEKERITSCTTADECGAILPGGCGCGHGLPIRGDADGTTFRDLQFACGDLGPATTCECLTVRDFGCVDHHCTANRVGLVEIQSTTPSIQ